MDPSMLVTYHYVYPRTDAPAGIRPLFVDEFEQQLDWIQERYRVLHPDEFPNHAARTDTPACVLTFDDGTRDHLETVLPILKDRALSGVFFVITGPMETGLLPATHALHWALGRDENEVWEFLCASSEDLGDEGAARAMYHYEDTELRARIKYAVNVALGPEESIRTMNRMVEHFGTDPRALGRQWFLDSSEVRALHDAGMAIGNHGVTHGSVPALGAERVIGEIHAASESLAAVTGVRPRWYTCPFGGSGATKSDEQLMRAAMQAAGIECTVTAAKGDYDSSVDLLAIPRRDAAFLPPRVALVD